MKAIGQSPVVTKKEVNGFILNRLQYAVIMEAWRLVEVCIKRLGGGGSFLGWAPDTKRSIEGKQSQAEQSKTKRSKAGDTKQREGKQGEATKDKAKHCSTVQSNATQAKQSKKQSKGKPEMQHKAREDNARKGKGRQGRAKEREIKAKCGVIQCNAKQNAMESLKRITKQRKAKQARCTNGNLVYFHSSPCLCIPRLNQ